MEVESCWTVPLNFLNTMYESLYGTCETNIKSQLNQRGKIKKKDPRIVVVFTVMEHLKKKSEEKGFQPFLWV